MISTLLLDVGGTLVMPNFERMADEYAADGVTVSAASLERAEAEVRLAIERPEFVRSHTDPWLAFMHDIARFAGVNDPPSDAFERLRTYHDTMNLWERVIAGTETALRTLAGRYRLGVVSNANGTVRKKLERVGLGQFFETVVDSAEEGSEKPDPRLFRVALERLGARGEDQHVRRALRDHPFELLAQPALAGAGGAGDQQRSEAAAVDHAIEHLAHARD
ncbi:MAG TPA: HAD family hydrolase, partial [Polyangiaceae bacterium]|nr:HAD family hydrolase [Polyangiaceae bacterium]